MSAVETIVAKLDGAQQHGDSWSAKCPAHDDGNPSLSVTERDVGDPGAIVHCHAGCTPEAITGALGMTPADLFDKKTEPAQRRREVATYTYTDEDGNALFDAVRYEPKDFRQRRVLPDGRHDWRLGDVRRTLYRLPRVIEAVKAGQVVYIVEGEKDVEALEHAGAVATCSPMGAGKWNGVSDAADVLRGAEIVVVIDNDKAGVSHGRDVVESLCGVADNLTVTRAAIGKDAADHLGAGRPVDEFEIIASDSPNLIELGKGVDIDTWLRADEPDDLDSDGQGEAYLPEPVDWHELFSRDSEHEWLVEDVWPLGRQLHIFAARKTGKSLLMLWIAANLAIGRDPFTGRAQAPQKITYLDYEMTEEDIVERLEEMDFTADQLAGRLTYYLWPSIAALDTAEGGATLLELARRDEAVAVVLDTVSRVVEGEENSNDTFKNFYRHTGMKLKRAGIGLARLDHEGHEGGRSRGASAKADDVDVVWQLKRTDQGLTLKRQAARMSWVPDVVELASKQEPLLFVRTTDSWPAGTKAKAAELDELGLPTDVSRREAIKALKDDGRTPGNTAVLSKAIAYRKVHASILTIGEVA